MTTASHNGPKRFWPSDKEITPFNLANCVHCHRQCTKQSSNELGVSKGHEVWIDEQLRPCVKSRLVRFRGVILIDLIMIILINLFSCNLDSKESSTLASASSEYSSYVQLKFRVVLSEVYVTVSDPRGRLVKNIGKIVKKSTLCKTSPYLGCTRTSVPPHLLQESISLRDRLAM